MKILIVAAASAGHVGVFGSDDVWTQKVGLPVRGAERGIVRIERIDGIIHGGHDHQIMDPFAGDVHVGHHERLRVNPVIHRMRGDQPEAIHVDVRVGEGRLVGILTRARIVVVIGEDGDLGGYRQRADQPKDKEPGKPCQKSRENGKKYTPERAASCHHWVQQLIFGHC